MRSKYLHHYFDYDFSVIRWSWGNFSTYCQFDDRTFYTNSTTELFIEYDIWAGLYGYEPYPGSSMPSTAQYEDATGVEKHKYAHVGTYSVR